MQTHDLQQGSPEWLAYRASARNASDAAAMNGCSPHLTRTVLLQAMHLGMRAEVGPLQQRRFDKGHAIEAAKRPVAEAIVGEDLYPVVGSAEVDGVELSASFDGLTLMEDTNWECKSLNEDLRVALPHAGPEGNDAAALPKCYRIQMEQQLAVCGGTRVLFTASDGENDDRHCWYYPDPALRAEIVAGWKQFDTDLAAYVLTEVKEMPKAEVTLSLPALFIHAKGEITTSNMKEYGEALAKRLADVRAIQLMTDQDFSNAKESAKLLRENIQQAKLAKDAMLAQTVTVGEAARMIDTWCEDMRLTALKLEQDVEREDKAKKAAMITMAKAAYEQHIEALKADTGGSWILLVAPDWASALKNKRNFASMQDALDTMLANAKIVADESARKIRAATTCIDEEGKGYEFLLADRLALIAKPVDDLRVLIRARITEHQAVEQRRLEASRERIRREEQERADREARERVEAEQRAQREQEAARQAEEQRAQQAAAAAKPAQPPAAAPIAPPAAAPQAAAANSPVVVPIKRAAPESPPTLKLGAMSERFGPGFTMTADFVQRLGIEPAATEKASKLFHEHQFAQLCEALVAHVRTVQAKHEQRQAA
jgi:predicted phage-related endonuclease